MVVVVVGEGGGGLQLVASKSLSVVYIRTQELKFNFFLTMQGNYN